MEIKFKFSTTVYKKNKPKRNLEDDEQRNPKTEWTEPTKQRPIS